MTGDAMMSGIHRVIASPFVAAAFLFLNPHE